MKSILTAAAICMLAAPAIAQSNIEVGLGVGMTWPMSGDSPLNQIYVVPPVDPRSFTDDFNSGISWSGYAAGPLGGMFGWRVDGGFDKTRAREKDGAVVGLDYKTFRYMAGLQIANFATESKSRPYAFVVAGGIHEDGEFETKDEDNDQYLDLDGRTAFGMSFGAGWNYLVGESWGLGLDLHVNAGFFEDATRWFWTPSGQIFFKF